MTHKDRIFANAIGGLSTLQLDDKAVVTDVFSVGSHCARVRVDEGRDGLPRYFVIKVSEER